MRGIRVLVVEDDGDARRLACVLLERGGGVTIQGEADTTADAVALAGQLQPDVVVLDNQLLDGEGVAVIPSILAAAPATRVVMCSATPGIAGAAITAGAATFVPKERTIELLATAVREAAGTTAV